MRPNCLNPGDEVRVIAPASSLAIVSEENRKLALAKLEAMGFKITFGKHVLECDIFNSSSIDSRIEDLHEAFSDPNVKGILTVLGGNNSNQLLSEIDYDLIARNPKFFCGFSDITALQNALFARAGLITYSGPHFSTFAMKKGLDYTEEYFKKAAFSKEPILVNSSEQWSSDTNWFLNQEKRHFERNEGPKIIFEGEAEGTIVGANHGTFLRLKGTQFMPSLEDTVLFVEATERGRRDVDFDRDLQSLIDLPDFSGVRALLIGRFEKCKEMDEERLVKIIQNKAALHKIPVAYDFDFGHTSPLFTFPIGGKATIKAKRGEPVVLQVL